MRKWVSATAWLSTALMLAACNKQDNAACMGWNAPTLNLYVLDAAFDEDIADAMLTIDVPGDADGTYYSAIWQQDAQSYQIAEDVPLYSGRYAAEISHPSYRAVRVEVELEEDMSCGARNDWQITVPLCPSQMTCV